MNRMAAGDSRLAPRFDVVALGEAMIEFNQTRADDPHTWLQGFGGDTSNMAIAAARLGARVGYATRVGNDAFGRRLIELWTHENVSTESVVVDDEAPTGVYFVSHDASGHAFSYLRAGSAASRMSPSSLPVAALRATRVLHLSGISQAISASACDACFAAIDIARGTGAEIAYDTNLRLKLWSVARARAIIVETLRMTDWALPGLDDARHLFGSDDPERIVDECHALGAANVVLKLGAEGCLASNGHRRERVPACRVASVDATGAGDCFDGAFIARITRGDDVFAAARFANAAAALATTGYGAVAPLPRAAEVERLLAAA
jgi:2-dehydro-3-deoxygluconokinase